MKVTVQDLIGQAVPLAGRSGLKREIKSPHLIAPKLASPSTWKHIGSGMVHLPPAQAAYLRSLAAPERIRLISAFLGKKPAGIVISGSSIHQELLRAAEAVPIPVFKTKSAVRLTHALAQKFAQHINLHGVLVDVFGLGTLIIGESAIGKSEAALDLVLRGHKLAADDLVVLEKKDGQIRGRATDMGTNLLEVRGLGVIDVRALYGGSATVRSAPVGLVVELEEWKPGRHYSLLGLRERRYRILGVNVPYLKLPVKPGRTMATLIEVAARNQLLKNRGIYTARELNRRLKKRLAG